MWSGLTCRVVEATLTHLIYGTYYNFKFWHKKDKEFLFSILLREMILTGSGTRNAHTRTTPLISTRAQPLASHLPAFRRQRKETGFFVRSESKY